MKKTVNIGGEDIDLSNYPHVAAMVTDEAIPRAQPLSKKELHAWAEQERQAREKIVILVRNMKARGKELQDASPRALADIITAYGLDKDTIDVILAETWNGGQGGEFDLSCLAPEQFFAGLRLQPAVAPLTA